VGTIERVEEVPRSQKRENPQEILGKQAILVVNLALGEMAGERSEGVLFDIGCADGITAVLAMPERAVRNGTRAG